MSHGTEIPHCYFLIYLIHALFEHDRFEKKLFYNVQHVQTSVKVGPNEFHCLIDRLNLRIYDKEENNKEQAYDVWWGLAENPSDKGA